MIYIILHTEHDYTFDEDEVHVEGYFADKDSAIANLERQGFRHVADDEYELNGWQDAKILSLEEVGL